ncbi:MAG: sulfatase [Planctomycetota bacterium]
MNTVTRLLVACTATAALSAADQTARPNIVFIFSDDHAWQAISAYGESRKLIDTPAIDRIAKEGMRFNRCLVPNPICGPSRACVLTGTYSHINGFYNNTNNNFDGSQATFPKALQAAGYQTAIVGKWHLGSNPTGFDHWEILPNQGEYFSPRTIANGKPTANPGAHVTDLTTANSLAWLKTRDRSKPFMLMFQQKAPHREWSPAIRHLDHDQGRVYPEPASLFDDYAGRGIAERDQEMTLAKSMQAKDVSLVAPPGMTPEQRAAWDAYYEPRNAAFRAAKPTGNDLVRWRYQRYMHDYLACVRGVDEGVGEMLDYLDREGLADNTIVVYSSDQGFFLGEHGWFDKRWIFEESLRTPLLVRWPTVVKPGSTCDKIVSNIDFAQTLLDAAGVAAPERMQGRSLVPLLKGQTPADWRTSFYYQYYEYPVPHRVRPHYGVVTDRYKLVKFYATGEDYSELFDLKTDPGEMRSVFGQPEMAGVQKQLEQELARLRSELKVPDETPAKAFGNKPIKQ